MPLRTQGRLFDRRDALGKSFNYHYDGTTIDDDKWIDIDLFDKDPTETVNLKDVQTFKLEEAGDKHTFTIERDKWAQDFINVSRILIVKCE